jgi:hypothetical protein
MAVETQRGESVFIFNLSGHMDIFAGFKIGVSSDCILSNVLLFIYAENETENGNCYWHSKSKVR